METLEKMHTFSALQNELGKLREREITLVRQRKVTDGEVLILQNEIKNLNEETEVVYVEVDDIVFEIQKRSQKETTHLGLKTKDSEGGMEDYFYSKQDNKIHLATGWHSYYFYDEESKTYSQNNVHKIIATSNQEKYPNLGVLTVRDLLKNAK